MPVARPVIVGIDARVLFRNRRGIGNVLHNLLREIGNVDATTRYLLFTDTGDGADLALPRNFEVVSAPPRFYPAWEQVVLPLLCSRHDVDLLHCPANTGPVFLPRRTRLVLTIHDLINFSERYATGSDSVFRRAARLYSRLVIPRAARAAAAVTTVSEFSREEILGSIRGVAPERIAVIRNAESFTPAPEPSPGVGPRDDEAPPFFLCLGAVDPRKNTARTVSAFLRCAERLPRGTRLVVVGLQRITSDLREVLRVHPESAHRVELRGYVPDAELSGLYRTCIAFLYLSRYEGFGMPLVDAMRHGCPILSSDTTSVPEVAGDAALSVDPDDEETIADAMVQVSTDPVLRGELVARGRAREARFSWSTAAAQLLAVYRRCAGLAPAPAPSLPEAT